MTDPGDDLRAWRRRAYDELRRARPELFTAADAVVIEDGKAEQEAVAAETRAGMRTAGVPEEYGDVGVVYRDAYLSVVRDAVRFRDGRLGSYIRMVPATPCAGSVVLPVTGDGVLLVRHFRHAPRAWLWEAPRGFGEPGEEPERTAERELHEELGLVPAELVRLGVTHPDAGISASEVVLYVARVGGQPVPDLVEGIDEVRLLPLPELDDWIARGAVSDGFTLSAYAMARARGLLG